MEEEKTGARSPLITFSHFLPKQVPRTHCLCRPVVLPCHRRAAARLDEMLVARNSLLALEHGVLCFIWMPVSTGQVKRCGKQKQSSVLC